MHTHTHRDTCSHRHIYMCIPRRTCARTKTCTYTDSSHIQVCVRMHTQIYAHTYIYPHTNMYTQRHTYTRVHVHTHRYMHRQTHTSSSHSAHQPLCRKPDSSPCAPRLGGVGVEGRGRGWMPSLHTPQGWGQSILRATPPARVTFLLSLYSWLPLPISHCLLCLPRQPGWAGLR